MGGYGTKITLFNSLENYACYISSTIYVGNVCHSDAIAEAVSRWLLTAAARVWQVGFVMDKVASGQVFSEYFGFPSQNRSFNQLLHPHNHPGQVQ
jgi:hypothetical protein